MMRSLFSGVSGLKTHQTRMDVIGNNIANVNTTAYKAQNMVFSDLLYQQTQAASGANADTGRGGINARQIGLGAKTAAINTAITRQGSAQSTNNPWDVMISGDSFFIVDSGSQTFFTRDGSFTIDGAGNLVMASTGYRVMGWQVDPETGDIRSDVVSALQVMNRDNLVADPESTTMGYASGILDKNDTNVHSSSGKIMTLQFYDQLGYSYTAKMSVHALSEDGKYYVQLDDITNSDGKSLKDYYKVNDISQIAQFGGQNDPIVNTKVYSLAEGVVYNETVDVTSGAVTARSYLVTYPLSKILNGFSDNVMMGMTKSDKLTVTSPTANGKVDTSTTVTVQGEVDLPKNVLQESYGLAYDIKTKQYYRMKDDGTREAMGPDSAGDLTDAQIKAWGEVLGSLSGKDSGVTLADAAGQAVGTTGAGKPDLVMADDGTVTLKYVADFKPAREADFSAADQQFGVTLPYPLTGMTAEQEQDILEQAYGLHADGNIKYSLGVVTPNGMASITSSESFAGNLLMFDTENGKFMYVGNQGQNSATLSFSASATNMTGDIVDLAHFTDISIDFSSVANINNGKVSTMGLDSGDGSSNNLGSGRKRGELIGVEVAQDGKIRASYDNGMTKLLGQIAVAKFANAAGLAKAGNNLYSTTMNSGEFDGIGQDITADGEGSMESGVLEMSNVDLAGEFTEMITTQRGFQANSRIITTSDSMLEELVNLKR